MFCSNIQFPHLSPFIWLPVYLPLPLDNSPWLSIHHSAHQTSTLCQLISQLLAKEGLLPAYQHIFHPTQWDLLLFSQELSAKVTCYYRSKKHSVSVMKIYCYERKGTQRHEKKTTHSIMREKEHTVSWEEKQHTVSWKKNNSQYHQRKRKHSVMIIKWHSMKTDEKIKRALSVNLSKWLYSVNTCASTDVPILNGMSVTAFISSFFRERFTMSWKMETWRQH